MQQALLIIILLWLRSLGKEWCECPQGSDAGPEGRLTPGTRDPVTRSHRLSSSRLEQHKSSQSLLLKAVHMLYVDLHHKFMLEYVFITSATLGSLRDQPGEDGGLIRH